ncbi:MAG: NAD(P)/FAD-dependent oxidoreductase [Thermoplasmatales archaeon]|nr:MAG: NAD(P)/FAD-dependent oxidoreductase [Thermoplasmatales archaeon]
MFDVVVVGGNLSGSNAAVNAASKGISVALIERNREPFAPAHCGEATAYTALDLLDLDKNNYTKNEIKSIIVNIASSKEYVFKLKKIKIFIFDRNCVEKNLLEKAEKKGVKLLLGTSMRSFNPPNEIVLDDNRKIRGKIIIDASGIACQVGRRVGIDTKISKKDIGVCIQSRVKGDFNSDTMKMWFHKPYAPFGYAWLFPLNEKMANIGLGVPGTQKVDLSNLLKKYVEDMTGGEHEIINTFRACVPLAAPMKKLTKDNIMIVGDAARLVNSTLGSGIENAVFSGSLAGLIASKYIRKEIPSLEIYQDAMYHNISMLNKYYIRREKLFEDEERFVKGVRRAFSILCFSNKLFPTLLQKSVKKYLEKNKLILELHK